MQTADQHHHTLQPSCRDVVSSMYSTGETARLALELKSEANPTEVSFLFCVTPKRQAVDSTARNQYPRTKSMMNQKIVIT